MYEGIDRYNNLAEVHTSDVYPRTWRSAVSVQPYHGSHIKKLRQGT